MLRRYPACRGYGRGSVRFMCRSIKTLRSNEVAVTEPEIRAAALQYVRKISGFRQPSNANSAVFEAAVDQITLASKELLEGLSRPRAPRVPRTRGTPTTAGARAASRAS
jgi:hypothetical protein